MPTAGTLPRHDPRWVLAARAFLLASPGALVAPEHRERLVASACSLGFTPIHARAIITIAESAACRGRLDHQAAYELMQLPEPAGPPVPWLVRVLPPVLIAALSLIAGVLAFIRLR